jgi:intein/homing endonuclease
MSFAAGTLVHTDKGLVLIEQIKVGDMVLSNSEDGTSQQFYKPVVRTIATDNMEVYVLRCIPNAILEEPREPWAGISKDRITNIVVTGNHPFWVESKGWVKANELDPDDQLVLANGDFAIGFDGGECAAKIIYHVPGDPMGWILRNDEFGDEDGVYYYDFDLSSNMMRVPGGRNCEPAKDKYIGWYHDFNQRYTCTVYNLEVADTHTYYVSDIGVWVGIDS